MAEDVHITKSLVIPAHDIDFRFSRSGGPGGQNVNKLETKVELLFDVQKSTSLSDVQRQAILQRCKDRIDEGGILHVVSQTSRSQWKNRQDAVNKFVALVQDALRPRKRRKATKPYGVSKERRLKMKKRRGEIKKLRGRIL